MNIRDTLIIADHTLSTKELQKTVENPEKRVEDAGARPIRNLRMLLKSLIKG
jgi:hypothetical protein